MEHAMSRSFHTAALAALLLIAGCKPAPAPDPALATELPPPAAIGIGTTQQVTRMGFTVVEARVLDARDQGAAGVPVHWSRVEGPGMLALEPDAQGANHIETRTDAEGRAHIVARSDRPGITIVAATLDKVSDPARRVAVARVEWRDVRAMFDSTTESAATDAPLRVHLEREGDGEAIAGRRLHWKLAEGSSGSFAPGGTREIVTRVDAHGATQARLLRPEDGSTESVVRLDLLDDCPTACSTATALSLGETRIHWQPVAAAAAPKPAPKSAPKPEPKPEPKPVLKVEKKLAPPPVALPGKLEIAKQGPRTRYLGQHANYQIVVRNIGNGPASDVTVSDAIPEGMKLVSSRPEAAGYDAGKRVASWALGTLAPREERRIDVILDARAPGAQCNVALATATGLPGTRAEACTQVRGLTALQLEVTDAPDPVVVGENATYRIEVLNQGSAPAHNIVVSAAWPEQLKIDKALGASALIDGRSLRYLPIAELMPGERAVYTVTLRALDTGDVRFAVEMRADELDAPVNETEATRLYE
jgi:uncharacterized repeat protein (TIGR01451 family)